MKKPIRICVRLRQIEDIRGIPIAPGLLACFVARAGLGIPDQPAAGAPAARTPRLPRINSARRSASPCRLDAQSGFASDAVRSVKRWTRPGRGASGRC